jgi:ATP-dependent DNA helicase MPH1
LVFDFFSLFSFLFVPVHAVAFIGQGSSGGKDKQHKKGLSQKEQLDVLQKFKIGEYNVL